VSVNLKYDTDPEALAWARERVQGLIDKMRRFEEQAKHAVPDAPDRARQWRVFGNLLESDFIGGSGCVIAAFDERMVQLAPILAEAIESKVTTDPVEYNRRVHLGLEPTEPEQAP
jgi:hypothetical protein